MNYTELCPSTALYLQSPLASGFGFKEEKHGGKVIKHAKMAMGKREYRKMKFMYSGSTN